jgi:hypothetical protein
LPVGGKEAEKWHKKPLKSSAVASATR